MRVGIDIGGTGTRIVAIDHSGAVVSELDTPTLEFAHCETPQARIDLMVSKVSTVLNGSQATSIGIGASGPIDLRNGLINNPDTLPAFTGMNLAEPISKALDLDVWIDNDAVAAAHAELYMSNFENAKDTDSLLSITLGTGIGVCVLGPSGPFRALDGQHPEASHISVGGSGHECYCGLTNCWEMVASRRALERITLESGGDLSVALQKYSVGLSEGLASLITLFRPKAIVFGGSVSKHWLELGPLVGNHLRGLKEVPNDLKIWPSKFGVNGGAIGAALLPEHLTGFVARRIGSIRADWASFSDDI
jgi:glucokinase